VKLVDLIKEPTVWNPLENTYNTRQYKLYWLANCFWEAPEIVTQREFRYLLKDKYCKG